MTRTENRRVYLRKLIKKLELQSVNKELAEAIEMAEEYANQVEAIARDLPEILRIEMEQKRLWEGIREGKNI